MSGNTSCALDATPSPALWKLRLSEAVPGTRPLGDTYLAEEPVPSEDLTSLP